MVLVNRPSRALRRLHDLVQTAKECYGDLSLTEPCKHKTNTLTRTVEAGSVNGTILWDDTLEQAFRRSDADTQTGKKQSTSIRGWARLHGAELWLWSSGGEARCSKRTRLKPSFLSNSSYAARALISEARGEHRRAKAYTARALPFGEVTHSGFTNYPKLGLVGLEYKTLKSTLRGLASEQLV